MRSAIRFAATFGLLLMSAVVDPAWASPDQSELLVANGPATIAPGPVGAGQILLTLPVKHRLTGRLLNRITLDSVFGRDTPLEPGQPVFGVPLADGRMAWCAPRLEPGRAGYRSACLRPSHAGLYEWEIRRSPAMAPADIGQADGGTSGQASAVPEVRRGEAPLPPMTLDLVLKDAGEGSADQPAARTYEVDLTLDWGEGAQVIGRLPIVMTAHGADRKIMGLKLKFRPGPEPGQLVVSKRSAFP